MSDLKKIFSKEFYNEYQLVDAIKKHLLTDDQKQFLSDNNLSIEDCLNGRVSGKFDTEISIIFREWNTKIGKKIFLEDSHIISNAANLKEVKKTAKEFWEEKFDESPQSDADKLAVAMMTEYAESLLKKERKKYNELIMAVGNKYPDETRHQTALRYIKQAEISSDDPAREALNI